MNTGEVGKTGRSAQADPPLARPVSFDAAPPGDSSRLGRLWLALPDWWFRLLGAAFFFGFLGWEISDYFQRGFWRSWNYWRLSEGHFLYLPWAKVLIDITYLLIAVSFVFRIPPRSRARRAREILVPLAGTFWPYLPFAVKAMLVWTHWDLSGPYVAFMFDTHLTLSGFIAGSACVILGNVLDVWGYGVLFRSFSLMPEARELKVVGPYRFIRHPVYFGQMLSQAGVWLFFATWHIVWIGFYLCFVGLQLYRSWMEDQVLERAFGDSYLAWKRETFWVF